MAEVVISPLNRTELEKLFDKDSVNVINFFLKELLLTVPELIDGQKDLPIYSSQEYVEQWFVQALGAKPVGAGSYPIDVIKHGEYGADIKSLTYKISKKTGEISNSSTGEASLGQNFKDDDNGETLDYLFSTKQFDQILNKWKKILNEKYNRVLNDHGGNLPIYYFFILRGPKDFYLAGAKVNPVNVEKLSVKKTTNESVFISNYLDEQYGNCKIYKAKKRMELRLNAKTWIDQDLCIKFSLPKDNIIVNLRELSIQGKLDEYFKKKFQIVEEKLKVN